MNRLNKFLLLTYMINFNILVILVILLNNIKYSNLENSFKILKIDFDGLLLLTFPSSYVFLYS